MRAVKGLLLAAAVAIFLLSGVALALAMLSVAVETNPIARDIMAIVVRLCKDETASVGIAYLAWCVICVILLLLYRRAGTASVVLEDERGELEISVSAIQGYVRNILSTIPEVKACRCTVKKYRGGVDIRNEVDLWSDVSLPPLKEKVRKEIVNKVTGLLGIPEEAIRVGVHVSRILTVEKESDKGPPVTGIDYGNGT